MKGVKEEKQEPELATMPSAASAKESLDPLDRLPTHLNAVVSIVQRGEWCSIGRHC